MVPFKYGATKCGAALVSPISECQEQQPNSSVAPTSASATQAAGQQPGNVQPDPVQSTSMQPNQTPTPVQTSGSPTVLPQNQPQNNSPQRIPYWLQQAERFLRVIVRIYLGLLVCFAPWYPPAWDANPLFMSSPWLMEFITHGAVRGIVSGLGLLNLWIALRDALQNPSDPGTR